MLTLKQKKWINHLSNTDKVVIVQFDLTAEDKFLVVKNKIQHFLGKSVLVEHHGATALGISGQNEIDIYVPTLENEFCKRIEDFKTIFGEPKSHYLLERARFVTFEDGKHIDVFVINEECSGWHDLVKFESYLREHKNALDEYQKLKERGISKSTREYYQAKTEFLNEILSRSN